MRTERVADVLVRIVARRRERLAAAEEPALASGGEPRRERFVPGENRFLDALRGGEEELGREGTSARRGAAGPSSPARRSAVIAEVKMGSPRLGSLAGRFDPRALARAYAKAGAAALSVVVEPDFFFGSYELLAACREASGLPAIAKDFVVDPLQLEWAREAGADAVLLVAALYEAEELAELAARARGLGLVPLVETHDPGDLEVLAGGEWELVGVNSRDLRTFRVDLGHAETMARRLPAGAVKVAESGIATAADVAQLAAAGFDAFLVGESLLTADDPTMKLAELVNPLPGVGR